MAENPHTDRPIFRVKALPEGKGGQPLDLTNLVLSFEYEDHESRADKLSLTVDNWNLEQFDNPTWKKGTILEVVWGYPGKLTQPHRVLVQKIRGGRQLTIEAHGMAMTMHKVKKSRVWNNMTLTEIAKKVADEYAEVLGTGIGKGAVVKDKITGVSADEFGNLNIQLDPSVDKKVAHRVQAAETDAAFLSRLAKRHGARFYVDAQGVHFKERNLQQSPLQKSYTWFNGQGEMLDFEIENDVTARAGAVTKKGIDPNSKKVISHRADNDSTNRHGLAPVIEIVDPRTGVTTLQKRSAEEHTEHTTESTEAGAKGHAQGKFRETQFRTVKLSFKAVGDPEVLAKRVIEIKGIGKRLSGKYYLTAVTHTINGSGYAISAKAHTDGHGATGAKSKAALNKKDATEHLEQIEKIDPRTGERSVQFRHKAEEHH